MRTSGFRFLLVVGLLFMGSIAKADGRAMRHHGMAASILGILQLTVGGALGVGSLVLDARCKYGCQGSAALSIPGMVFTGSGAVAATAGVPMWIYGAREARSVSITASGLRITF